MFAHLIPNPQSTSQTPNHQSMLGVRLIRRLHKCLCQVLAILARVIASSVQRLRILLLCLRRFITNISGPQRHSKNPSFFESAPESYSVLTGAGCSQANLPLPLYHDGHITPATAVNNNQDVVLPPPPPSTIAILPTFQPTNPHDPTSSDDFHVTFTPVGASNYLRYENRSLADNRIGDDMIRALRRDFPKESCSWLKDAPQWQPFVHPEGALYFYNEGRKTFTEINMNQNTFPLVNRCLEALHKWCPELLEIIDNGDIELVVQLSEVDDSLPTCQYYFVDHVKRTLFWVQDHRATDDIFCGLRGIYDPSHIAYALESEYWAHCERYPNHKQDQVKLLKELRQLVVYARAEVIISDSSLSPFGADELSSILELISHLEALQLTTEDDSFHATCVIARFMHYFNRAKFFNFCGLPCARLDADSSVYKDGTGSFHPMAGTFSSLLNAMLFWSPQAHYNDLRRVWIDKCLTATRWGEFGKNLMAEFTGISLYSTVMLAVDVSFLAVPNVNIQQSQSIGVIAIYISIIFITGSLIASVQLTRQAKIYSSGGMEETVLLLSKTMESPSRTRALVTFYSLPYAMLIWGMVFFSIALLYNVFKSTTVVMMASVISATVIVAMFMLWISWAVMNVYILRSAVYFIMGQFFSFIYNFL